MKFTLSSYRSLTKQLARIAAALESFNATYTHKMLQEGFGPVPDSKLKDEIEISYVDPEQEYLDEVKKAMGRIDEEEDE